MKFLHVTFHFEYGDAIEGILDRHGIRDYVRYPMMEGKDAEGKHFGSQIFPGSTSVVQALLPDGSTEPLLGDLRRFKQEKSSHKHLQAVVLPVERSLE